MAKKSIKSRLDIARMNRRKRVIQVTSKRGPNKANMARKAAKVAMVFVIMILMTMLGASIYAFSWLQDLSKNLPSPEAVFPVAPASSQILDRHGVELYKIIGDFNSDPIKIDQVPEHVKWAFIAAEDADFFTHKGFDTSGILFCSFNVVSGGGRECGASTITQQLIKLTALSEEKNKYVRKIKELFLSTNVEQDSTKEEILQMYLTVVPFGSNIVGIKTASNFYFRKEPKDLTLGEAAILASIINDPSYLSPTKPVDGDTESAQLAVKERQETVVLYQIERRLDQINNQIKENNKEKAKKAGVEYNPADDQLITQEMVAEAKAQTIAYKPPVATNKLAGNFVDFVLSELSTKNYKNGEEPFTAAELQNGGYKITTTLDYEMQKVGEDAVKVGVANYAYPQAGYHNAALMTMQPGTGQIFTMVGSKDFYAESEGCNEFGEKCQFNPEVNIMTSDQSPGSTNKPLGYYMAFDQGIIYPKSILPDIQITIGSYSPKNWNGGFRGIDYTARDALRDSQNMPALIVIESIGVQNYLNKAREFGYTTYTDDSQMGHSVILGGTTVYPIEHATAYGVFANQGDYVEYQSILKIEDRDGNVIFEAKEQRTRVASAQGTYLLNQTLSDAPHFRSWDGRDVSAKTGTSEEGIDNWIVAYSPDFVTLAWAGNNNNEVGWENAYPIYTITNWLTDYMRNIGDRSPFDARTPFPRPGFVFYGGGTCNDQGECLGLGADWMIQDNVPKPDRIVKKVFVCDDQKDRLAREIDKATGHAVEVQITKYRMPAPTWQGMLDEDRKKGGNLTEFPTQPCDVNRFGSTLGPVFYISSPTSGSTTTGATLNVSGTVISSAGEISSVQVKLSGQNLGNLTQFVNFSQNFNIGGLGLENGSYTLELSATDTAGVTNAHTVSNVIIGSAISSNFSFTLPPSPLVYGVGIGNGINKTVTATYGGSAPLTGVTLNVVKGGAVVQTIPMSKSGNQYNAQWGASLTASDGGDYSFYVTASSKGGAIQSANSGVVTVAP